MKQFRIGIIGTENSHAYAFSTYFNKPDANGNYRYPDCRATLVYGHYPEESEKVVREYGADAVASNFFHRFRLGEGTIFGSRQNAYGNGVGGILLAGGAQGKNFVTAHDLLNGEIALGHGEIEAIADACRNLGGWRLWECTLYVTLEPCPMCAGAIINARIPRVVFGASDAKCGACGSVCNLFPMEFNHHPQVEKGLCEEECRALLQEFFKNLRLELNTRPKWKKPQA